MEHHDSTFAATTSLGMPPLPELGRPDTWYAKRISAAEAAGDSHAREAMKVGQYLTLALAKGRPWDEKMKYFRHALKKHCMMPAFTQDETVKTFYTKLGNFVRDHCGAEALKLASAEDDMFAARLSMGQDREEITSDAETFFDAMLGNCGDCPDCFRAADWEQLKLLRDQWM